MGKETKLTEVRGVGEVVNVAGFDLVGGKPDGLTHIIHVNSVEAEIFSPEVFHLLTEVLVHGGDRTSWG